MWGDWLQIGRIERIEITSILNLSDRFKLLSLLLSDKFCRYFYQMDSSCHLIDSRFVITSIG